MSEEDDREEAMSQAFGGMIDHSEKYKREIEQLKHGTPSGISGVFGKAADLLPPEHLETYAKGQNGYEVGESMLSDGVEPEHFRNAVKDMIAAIGNEEGDVFNSAEYEFEVIGVFFDGEQKKLLLADGTVVDAPEKPSMEKEKESIGDLVVEQFRELTAALFETDEPEVLDSSEFAEPEEFDQEPAQFHEDAAADLAHQMSQPPEQTPTLRVKARDGSWLWDVHSVDGWVTQVIAQDGLTIQMNRENEYIVVRPPAAGQRVPQVEVARMVICEPETGNIYYDNVGSTHSVALLNSGWRVDQFKKPGGEERFFVTEPPKPGRTEGILHEVAMLQLDPETGYIHYETMDGGAIVTLTSRKLFV
jgi:hypothetical protein